MSINRQYSSREIAGELAAWAEVLSREARDFGETGSPLIARNYTDHAIRVMAMAHALNEDGQAAVLSASETGPTSGPAAAGA